MFLLRPQDWPVVAAAEAARFRDLSFIIAHVGPDKGVVYVGQPVNYILRILMRINNSLKIVN
jgi:hypothetical protein